MNYVVDTHPLVWFMEGNARLSRSAKAALIDPSIRIIIPTIVLAEIAFLYAKKRIGVNLSAVLSHIASAANCIVYPLDEIVVEHLPVDLNIHDAIIVATAIVFRDVLEESVAVITKDSEIAASGLVSVIWKP